MPGSVAVIVPVVEPVVPAVGDQEYDAGVVVVVAFAFTVNVVHVKVPVVDPVTVGATVFCVTVLVPVVLQPLFESVTVKLYVPGSVAVIVPVVEPVTPVIGDHE